MKRLEQIAHNQMVIANICLILTSRWRPPSYRFVCSYLNELELKSSVGNTWTERSLYRMLQRNGYSGLWGLLRVNKEGVQE